MTSAHGSISDTALTLGLNPQWRILLISQHLMNDLSDLGIRQLGIHLTNNLSEFNLNSKDCDPFVPLSFSRLWTVQTTAAAIALLSQFIPYAAFVELPNVLPNVNRQIDRCR